LYRLSLHNPQIHATSWLRGPKASATELMFQTSFIRLQWIPPHWRIFFDQRDSKSRFDLLNVSHSFIKSTASSSGPSQYPSIR
jgi:hypothetical protein